MPQLTISWKESSSVLSRQLSWPWSRQSFQEVRGRHGGSRQGLDSSSSSSFRNPINLSFSCFQIPVPFHSRRQTRQTSTWRLFIRTNENSHALPLPPEIRRFGQEVCPGLLQMERKSLSWHGSYAGLPHEGDTRWRRLSTRFPFGKLVGRSPSMAGPLQASRPAQLGLITDDNSRQKCLLDAGSQVGHPPRRPRN